MNTVKREHFAQIVGYTDWEVVSIVYGVINVQCGMTITAVCLESA